MSAIGVRRPVIAFITWLGLLERFEAASSNAASRASLVGAGTKGASPFRVMCGLQQTLSNVHGYMVNQSMKILYRALRY